MLYIATMGERASVEAASIAQSLRASDFPVEIDTCGRSLKAQMKYAGKLGAQYTVVLGDNELDAGVYTLKNMQTGEEQQIGAEDFIEEFAQTAILAMEADLKEMFGLEEE
jgi:histidyl-tRNA synthetase